MSTTNISEDTLHHFETRLYELINCNPGISGVLLATTDGFEVATAGELGGCEASSAAAMTSSMLSLAIAMVNETQLSPCQNLIVEAGAGKILIMSVPGKNYPMLLTILTRPEAAFGQLLLDARITVRDLTAVLQAA
ncbi:MAG: hypothetical protein Tsb002_22060 [Wenzhouxiangellaceae bacterium]